MLDKTIVKEIMKSLGADLCGIASIDRLLMLLKVIIRWMFFRYASR